MDSTDDLVDMLRIQIARSEVALSEKLISLRAKLDAAQSNHERDAWTAGMKAAEREHSMAIAPSRRLLDCILAAKADILAYSMPPIVLRMSPPSEPEADGTRFKPPSSTT